jgi:hypothetical protein
VDNDNGIADKVSFSRWADSGGVYGYYDWLLQNELGIAGLTNLSLELTTGLRNCVTL